MQHRDRILKALNHKKPDEVPIDIGGMRSTGMHAMAYRNLRKYLGMDTSSIKLYDVFQQLAMIDEDILNYFGADVLPLNRLSPAFGIKLQGWKEGELPNGTSALVPKDFNPVKEKGVFKIKNEEENLLARRSEDSLYYDSVGVHHPLADADSVEEIREKYERNEITKEEENFLSRKSSKLREESNRAVMGTFGGSIFEAGQGLRGMKQWYIDLVRNQNMVESLLDLMIDDYIENLKTYKNAVGENIDIIVFGGDDLGAQDGPQISPETYREFFKPKHKKMWDWVKSNTDWKIFLHSCGSIYDFLPDLIDAGVDIINPVHINAKNMNPQRLKNKFGNDLVFWGGGCDTQEVLPNGSTKEVKKHTKKMIQTFAPGGGFVFTPVHNIQPDVPPENIVTMYDTVRETEVHD